MSNLDVNVNVNMQVNLHVNLNVNCNSCSTLATNMTYTCTHLKTRQNAGWGIKQKKSKSVEN